MVRTSVPAGGMKFHREQNACFHRARRPESDAAGEMFCTWRHKKRRRRRLADTTRAFTEANPGALIGRGMFFPPGAKILQISSLSSREKYNQVPILPLARR